MKKYDEYNRTKEIDLVVRTPDLFLRYYIICEKHR